jgi:hypothetical protein
MKRIIRIFAIALLLSTFAAASVFVVHHQSAYACSGYEINSSQTIVAYTNSSGSIDTTLALWYNSCTSTNIAAYTVNSHSGSPINVGISLRRASGPDGGATLVQVTCIDSCVTPSIYSPNNLDQVCLATNGLFVCTGWF